MTKYTVAMIERGADGVVLRNMLTARFVCKGDAVAYAIWRRDTMPAYGVQFEWAVNDGKGCNVVTYRRGV